MPVILKLIMIIMVCYKYLILWGVKQCIIEKLKGSSGEKLQQSTAADPALIDSAKIIRRERHKKRRKMPFKMDVVLW